MRKTKAELQAFIDTQNGIIQEQGNRIQSLVDLMARSESNHDVEIKRLKEEKFKQSKKIDELEREIKNHRGRVAKALDTAEEGATAAGLISRLAFRLLEDNENLRRDALR